MLRLICTYLDNRNWHLKLLYGIRLSPTHRHLINYNIICMYFVFYCFNLMYLISNEKQIILNVYSWVVLIMFARHSNFTQWYVQLYFSLCWTLTLRYRCKDVTNLLTRIHQFLNCWIYPVWYQHEHLKEICRNEFKILHSLGSSNNWVYKDISLSQCPSFLCHLRICPRFL